MYCTSRVALATFALLVFSQLALAGPIQWGYHAEGPNGQVLSSVSGLTALVYDDAFMPNPLLYGTKSSTTDNNYRTDLWRSQATVIITDELSGQSGSFVLYSDYIRKYELKANGAHLIYAGTDGGPAPTVLELGGDTYTITSPAGEFVVEVTPSTAATPEPGTFALAALGLGAFSLCLRRRAKIA